MEDNKHCGEIEHIYLFRSDRAKNNFFKHSENNDTKRLKTMFRNNTVAKIA